MDVWLPYTNCGIATYPNRAIGMTGLSPARLRPCRPLHQTPVVSLSLAIAQPGLLPSEPLNAVGFLPHCRVILMTTIIHFSGLNTEPEPLLHPASYSRCRVCTWTSLLTWWLAFGQVGLSRYAITHWVTSTNFIPIYVESQGFGFTLARSATGYLTVSQINFDCRRPQSFV